MTGLGRDTSRSPDRTGVCCAGRSAPSKCEMVTGPGFSSPNQPDQERTTAYRDSSGPDSRSDAHCATIFGDWEEPSGESPLKSVADGCDETDGGEEVSAELVVAGCPKRPDRRFGLPRWNFASGVVSMHADMRKGNIREPIMSTKIPEWVKPAGWGGIVGAVVVAIIGFSAG